MCFVLLIKLLPVFGHISIKNILVLRLDVTRFDLSNETQMNKSN